MKKQLLGSIVIASLVLSFNGFAQQAAPAVTPIKVAPAIINAPTPVVTAPTMSNATVVTPPKKQKRTSVDNTANMTAAAGGGQGLVWVNTKSKVYHCFGSKYYGKTKTGSYMTAAQAEAAGNHANDKKQCSM